jgi:hypothetical protein
MDKYIITIGNQTIEVWAKDHKSAMKKAIEKETELPKYFSILSTCLKLGDDIEDEMLFSIEYMKNNGYFENVDLQPLN